MLEPFSLAGAKFNEDRTRRYILWRNWELSFHPPRTVAFIMLNPSIADENKLDPTVNRCLRFAKRWGYGRMLVGNLYSKVSTDPKGVDFTEAEPTNIDYLRMISCLSETTVAAWGTNANPKVVNETCWSIGRNLHCLGKNKEGSPKHPLYLRNDARLIPYFILDKAEKC